MRKLFASILFCLPLAAQTTISVLPNAANTVVGTVRFYDKAAANYVSLASPDTLSGNITFRLPGADGSSGNCLQTDGSANLSFGRCSSGGLTPPVSISGSTPATSILTVTQLGAGSVVTFTGVGTNATWSVSNAGTLSGSYAQISGGTALFTGGEVVNFVSGSTVDFNGSVGGTHGQPFGPTDSPTLGGLTINGGMTATVGSGTTAIEGIGTTGVGVEGVASTGSAVWGVATSGIGGLFTAGAGTALDAAGTGAGAALIVTQIGSGLVADFTGASSSVFINNAGTLNATNVAFSGGAVLLTGVSTTTLVSGSTFNFNGSVGGTHGQPFGPTDIISGNAFLVAGGLYGMMGGSFVASSLTVGSYGITSGGAISGTSLGLGSYGITSGGASTLTSIDLSGSSGTVITFPSSGGSILHNVTFQTGIAVSGGSIVITSGAGNIETNTGVFIGPSGTPGVTSSTCTHWSGGICDHV